MAVARARFFWLGRALVGGWLCCVTACQRLISPAAYLAEQGCRSAVIPMDHVLHLTSMPSSALPGFAVPDSAAAMYRVAGAVLACPDQRLHLVVYFHGAGSWDYRLARAMGLRLKELLVAHGYPEARISYDALPAAGRARERPRYGVDFQAQRTP